MFSRIPYCRCPAIAPRCHAFRHFWLFVGDITSAYQTRLRLLRNTFLLPDNSQLNRTTHFTSIQTQIQHRNNSPWPLQTLKSPPPPRSRSQPSSAPLSPTSGTLSSSRTLVSSGPHSRDPTMSRAPARRRTLSSGHSRTDTSLRSSRRSTLYVFF